MVKTHIEDWAANVAGETEAAIGALGNAAKARVEGLASQAAAAGEQAYGQARDHVRGAAATVTTSVEQQPLMSLLAVGLVCGAVGFLLGRR